MKEMIAMVLVGGRGSRLQALTKKTAKPAVPFLGKYKLIDFVLSNLSHSDLDTIGIITQYEPQELMNYIGRGATWDLDKADGGIHFLTPFSNVEGEQFQKGTADAIRQHLSFIKRYAPEYVLILSGDHVYKMDYTPLLEMAKTVGYQMVIGTFTPDDDLSRYGVLELEGDTVVGFQEKPDVPVSTCASMGVYVFKTEILEKLLEEKSLVDFGGDVIPAALKKNICIGSYHFHGYFKDVGTIESLYQANMDILNDPTLVDLYDYQHHPLYANSANLPPHHIASPKKVTRSMIADGSLILGEVKDSVIAHGCIVKDDAVVLRSIIHPNVIIGEYAMIDKAIILEDTVIMPKTRLVFDVPTVVDNEMLWQIGGQDD
jgi:glucose-1-phosphate adenylyltransferase